MTDIDRETWAVILIILLVILLPIGALMIWTNPEPYHVTTGNLLREAAEASGLKVVSDKNITPPIEGVTGGHSYTVMDEEGRSFTIYAQSFDSSASRDAAIRAHYSQSVGKGRPLGELIVVGDQLIFIHPNSASIRKVIVPELKKKKAGIQE
ncbi:MAG: hypothetical protein MUF37_07365 [Methanoregulaceae archaeon]|jgi:hypothetical protein|nr:hypothetical protein [Methanoregulaceae archaeon]